MISTINSYFTEGCGRCELGGTPQCKVNTWVEELKLLRSILLSCELTETLKWGQPCYTFQKKNILIMSALKDVCVVGFFKGALIKDHHKVMTKPGDNSQAVRQFRFPSVKEIKDKESILREYIFQAIEIEKKGLKVNFKAKNKLEYPEELTFMFEKNPGLQEAFESLTPGRQRGYLLHFTQAKQSNTRLLRIEKYIPKILEGLGFHDR